MGTLVEEALSYAAIGWHVFPCIPATSAPFTEHGFKNASIDPAAIKAWWRKSPKAMIGVACGASGLVVLDIDVDPAEGLDGEASFKTLINGIALPPDVPTARTPRGGRHLYFAARDDLIVKNTASKLGRGLYTRGEGGYVIAPPSVNGAGLAYRWENWGAFHPAPDWLVAKPVVEVNAIRINPDRGSSNENRDRAYGEAALKGECNRVAVARDGMRNDTLFKAACRLFELVAGRVLGEDEARHGLIKAAHACGLDDGEITKTLDSAFAHGASQPRVVPDAGQTKSATASGNPTKIDPAPYAAGSLQHETFPMLKRVAGEIIVEGLTLLAARPKVGKTWLALDIAVAVDTGGFCLGEIKCEPGDVLFLALEDNKRRMKRRIAKLLSVNKPRWPNFACAHTWPRADQGGLDAIRNWIAKAKNPRLVVVDVLARSRKIAPNGRQQTYEADYEAIAGLQQVASDTGVAIIIIHHTRKGDAEDPLDAVSGTLGLVGAADAVLVLNNTTQGTRLYGRSRDVDEIDKAMEFNRDNCRWTILGETVDVHRSSQRQEILDALREEGEPMAWNVIAQATGYKRGNIRALLTKMVASGEIIRIKRGKYSLPAVPRYIDNNDNKLQE